MTPKGLTIDIIESDIKQEFPQVKEVYNTHLWMVTSEMMVFSCYMLLNQVITSTEQDNLISEVNNYLNTKYKLIESTIQVQFNEKNQYCAEQV